MTTPNTIPRFQSYIAGNWVDGSQTHTVHNPATGKAIGSVPELTDRDIQNAILAADQALSLWRVTLPAVRSNHLRKIADQLMQRQEECARIITSEQGKPLAEARGEVAYAASYFDWFAGESRRIYGEILPSDFQGRRMFVLREPVGVVAAITPWNFPIAMIARKMAAALAAGCTFIGKPAPETPVSALFLARICHETGLPPGVVNIVTGDAEVIGKEFMSSPLVQKITFTGSTAVGKLLMRQSADTVKKLTLELGGNAPLLIFDDADIEKAVAGAVYAKYRNAGQTCISVNRLLVHETIAPRFTEALVLQSGRLVVGDGMHPETVIGPLISEQAVAKVERHLKNACELGASLRLAPKSRASGSLLVSPAVISGVTPAMEIWNEEVFGPVSAITTFSSVEEGIRLANNSPHGLAAYIYSNDLSKALSVAEQLRVGMVGINDTAISSVTAPFGGVKESGFGREGGKEGIMEYLTTKYVVAG